MESRPAGLTGRTDGREMAQGVVREETLRMPGLVGLGNLVLKVQIVGERGGQFWVK